jgi:DNA-binding LacI/PurR family transcriptional regulator
MARGTQICQGLAGRRSGLSCALKMVTLADVATHAGVAQSTVSYVLSGKRTISQSTRRRVERSIRELGYRPHAGARALASRRTNVLALVTPLRPDLSTAVAMEFVISVVAAARGHAHDVLLLTNDEGPEGLRRAAGTALVDGFVLMDVQLRDQRIPVLRDLGLPAVLIGAPNDTSGLTCVDLDFTGAGARCVDHLADLGHGAIAFIGPSDEAYRRGSGFAVRTLAGVTAQAAARHVDCDPLTCGGTREDVEAVLERVLSAEPRVTGIVIHNETVLPMVLDALRAHGRGVPDDISVVAIAPDDIAEAARPAVSAVNVPAEEMGQRAVDLLMSKLAGNAELTTTLLAPRLLVRASSGAPRAGAEPAAVASQD